jgi:hypothetical protein
MLLTSIGWTNRRLWRGVVVSVAAIAAIASSPADVPGDPAETLKACAGDDDIEDSTVIAVELENSMHELVQCGGLTFALIGAVVTSAWVIANEGEAKPEAFAFQDGVYVTTGTGVVMDIQFYASADTPGFADGDAIPADLFAAESYLIGADATRGGEQVTVTFDGTGPLVALLGRGDAPTSPQTFTDADLADISTTLGSLRAETQIRLDDQKAKSRFVYTIDVPRDDVAVLLTRQGMTQNTEGVDGTRDDLSQVLTTTDWQLSYENVTQGLLGTAAFDVKGGPFDYHLLFTYAGTPEPPTKAYTCL